MTEGMGRDAMAALLARMADLQRGDPALQAASRRKRITILYEFPDVGLCFFTRLLDGSVEAGFEAPAEADMRVMMNSDVFDGLFTGTVNAGKAAARGDLRFAGNLAAAMRLQGLMADFGRLYLQAKRETLDEMRERADGGDD